MNSGVLEPPFVHLHPHPKTERQGQQELTPALHPLLDKRFISTSLPRPSVDWPRSKPSTLRWGRVSSSLRPSLPRHQDPLTIDYPNKSVPRKQYSRAQMYRIVGFLLQAPKNKKSLSVGLNASSKHISWSWKRCRSWVRGAKNSTTNLVQPAVNQLIVMITQGG